MVILMKSDKSLIKSVDSRLYQKENAVDNLTFYVPSTYEDLDLSEYTAVLSYSTSTNDAYMEILEAQDSDKENYLMYKLPVTTKITASAGTITLELSFAMNDEESDTKYVLHSSELELEVLAWADYYKYVSNDSLSAIDNKILELDAKADKLMSAAEKLELETPNDLTLTDDLLQLSHTDDLGEVTLIGDGIEILIPGDEDDEDEDHDGVIDIDDIDGVDETEDASNSSNGITFVEL